MIKTHTYSKKQQLDEKSDIASGYGMPPPSNINTSSRLAQIDDLKLFFATATQQWEPNKPLKRFVLPAGESVSCVLWNDLFFITGTDIVRSLTFRFHAFGRPVSNAKKFEEGIFSDLRNLKPGHDARLEEPKSELLDMLYKNNCIRTQKKQKVFFWFSVPHDRLFLDALERDLKREKMGMEPTTLSVAEPATSLSLDSTQELFDQLRKSMSQSAAATAQAIEDDIHNGPMPNTSLSLTHVPDNNWSNPPWSSSQSRLERAASQAKRSRVNSVPANIGQQQHFQLMQQKHNRMSHGSYFSNTSPTKSRHHRTSSSASSLLSNKNDQDILFNDNNSTTSTLSTLTDISKSVLSSPIHSKFGHHHQQQQHHHQDYLDPISHGVDQLEITSSLSNHSTSTTNSLISHSVMPSKSLDSNAMKKTKTIFGNLSLFDGSPTYKQRRRRAASVSSSALITTTSGGPERVRRHDKCHLRTPSTSTHNSNLPTINSNSSRLAMAAVKAGFAPNQIITPPTTMQMIQNNHNGISNWPTTSSNHHPVDYLCPVSNCGRLFKRSDHLERHMSYTHAFVCNVCGKHFPHSESLTQHRKLEHELNQNDHHASLMSGGGDNNDDDSSSPDDHQHRSYNNAAYQRRQQVLNHQGNNSQGDGFHSSPRHSFDGSRSSGWSTGISGAGSTSSSYCSSRCSTLSPMLDLDFDMPDVQQTQKPISTPIATSRSNTSLTTTDSSVIMNNNDSQLLSYYPTTSTSESKNNNSNILWNSNDPQLLNTTMRTSSSSVEDDFSSSSASSPCSTLQYGNDYKLNTSTNMTLLSPFKPMHPFHQQDMLQQQHLFNQQHQQQQQQQQVDDYQFVEDVSMLLTPTEYSTSIYAPYVDQQFTPYITSPDMNTVFGA
ncbi:STE like transcription factor-domain-containing protein [Thamnidium elegans]|nr:STE like transcription factor-domain-containing protein [Thamnidium elegans]